MEARPPCLTVGESFRKSHLAFLHHEGAAERAAAGDASRTMDQNTISHLIIQCLLYEGIALLEILGYILSIVVMDFV